MRNLLDDTVRRMSSRLAGMTSEERSATVLSTIMPEDIPAEEGGTGDLPE
jgi:hypothetical protein